jgi:hypothetical protein
MAARMATARAIQGKRRRRRGMGGGYMMMTFRALDAGGGVVTLM